MKKVLLIEDDANLAFMLTDGLENEGFEALHFADGESGIGAIFTFAPDIILLDVNLKGKLNGFDISKKIRQFSDVPVIFTTSRTQIEDLQEGYKIGNMDYLKKPFGIRELILRINELLSRKLHVPNIEKSYRIGSFFFIPSEQNLKLTEEKIRLQKNESLVLTLLCENKGKVVGKQRILEAVWDDTDLKQKEASLHNILLSLRTKLNRDQRICIESIPKIGWKLTEKDAC